VEGSDRRAGADQAAANRGLTPDPLVDFGATATEKEDASEKKACAGFCAGSQARRSRRRRSRISVYFTVNVEVHKLHPEHRTSAKQGTLLSSVIS